MTHSATARLMTQPAPSDQVGAHDAGTEDSLAEAVGERLGAGAEREGVGADHPGAVRSDVTAADGGEPEDDADAHRRADQQPDHPQKVAGALLAGVEQRHPQPGERDGQTQPHQDASRSAMPARVAAAQPGGELEGAEEGVADGGHDVHHERDRRGGEARVGRQELRSAGDLDEPRGAADDRDDGEGDQAGRQPPARPGRPAGAGRASRRRRDAGAGAGGPGHSTPAAVTARAADSGRQRRGVGARDAPQRVAEADHGDAVREGQEPVEGVRQHGERDGDDAADGEERGRPAGEDAARYSAMPKTRPPAR